jgi:hypothetical protein
MNDEVKMVACPYCAEQIIAAAKKCKHCGEIIDSTMRDIEMLKNQKQSVFMNAGGASSSSSSAAAAGGNQLRSFNHILHIFLSVISGGLWLFVYIFLYIFRNKSVYY